ncbi:hypothetical protein C4K18_0230 [Pseudomonas chlororaphis subsp. aurantiaca]|nr:hypothetical protein C4K18_0230 [Pseudomonas chlororaphis subsp. aurantiaca]
MSGCAAAFCFCFCRSRGTPSSCPRWRRRGRKTASGPQPACGLSRASLAPTGLYFGYIKVISMLLGDKRGHLRPPGTLHPMHLENIFDAVHAYAAQSRVLAGLFERVIKM